MSQLQTQLTLDSENNSGIMGLTLVFASTAHRCVPHLHNSGPFLFGLYKPPELTMLNSPDMALRLCVSGRVKTSSSEVCPGVSLTTCRASDLGASPVCKLRWTSAATKSASPSVCVTTAGWWETEEAKARNPEGGRGLFQRWGLSGEDHHWGATSSTSAGVSSSLNGVTVVHCLSSVWTSHVLPLNP